MPLARASIGRALIALAALGALAVPARAEAVTVFGYGGMLGEWELTADVTGAKAAFAIVNPAGEVQLSKPFPDGFVPLLTAVPPARHFLAAVHGAMSPAVEAGVEGMVQHALQGDAVGAMPLQLPPVRPEVGPDRQADVVMHQVAQQPM